MKQSRKTSFLKNLDGFSIVNMVLIVVAILLIVSKVNPLISVSVLLLAIVSDFIKEDVK